MARPRRISKLDMFHDIEGVNYGKFEAPKNWCASAWSTFEDGSALGSRAPSEKNPSKEKAGEAASYGPL